MVTGNQSGNMVGSWQLVRPQEIRCGVGCRNSRLPHAMVFIFLNDLQMVEELATFAYAVDLLQNYLKIPFRGARKRCLA